MSQRRQAQDEAQSGVPFKVKMERFRESLKTHATAVVLYLTLAAVIRIVIGVFMGNGLYIWMLVIGVLGAALVGGYMMCLSWAKKIRYNRQRRARITKNW